MKLNTYELQPNNTSQKSFYKKAIVHETDNKIELQSYQTIVITINKDKRTIMKTWNNYSATTMKHVSEFLHQIIGYSIGKAVWDKLKAHEEYSIDEFIKIYEGVYAW